MAKKLVIIATIHDHRYMKKAFIQAIIALFLGTSSSLLAQETL